jgi:hypothetical protein
MWSQQKWTTRDKRFLPYFKHPLFGGDSTNFILTTLSQPDRVQKIKERNDQVHLPIMD